MWLEADLACRPRSLRPTEVVAALGAGLEERSVRRTHQWILRDGARREPLVGAGPELSYVLDGENGLSLCHHVYRGNVADSEEFSTSLARMLGMLDGCQIARDTVTLVFDKGSAALANTVELQEAGVGWISALP
jgi:hypothetical protein